MVKLLIKKILLHLFKIVFYFVPKKQNECVLLSSHIPIQNLGDQALLCGSTEALASFSTIHIVQTGSDCPRKAMELLETDSTKFRFHNSFKVVFATKKSLKETILFLFFVSRFSHCYAIGADVLDGSYNASETSRFFDLMNDIAVTRTNVCIVGSSFSKNISKEAVKGLSELSRRVVVHCRDQYSLERIANYFPAKLSADAAFLMTPRLNLKFYPDKSQFSNFSKSKLNIGICLKNSDLSNSDKLFEFCDIINSLDFQGVKPKIIFLPHHIEDFRICEQIKGMLALEDCDIWMPNQLPAANEVKLVAGLCHLVITGRMHVAIAALGMSVVPICYSYGDKFSGLLKHFDLEPHNLLVLDDQSNLADILNYCYKNNNFLRNKVTERKGLVLGLAKDNFDRRDKGKNVRCKS